MSTETIPAPATLEVMPEETKQLAKIVKESSLSTETTATLQASFAALFDDARKILEQSRSITVTDSSQKLQVGLARQYRLALKKLRIDSAKTKSTLKEESLRYNKAVDGFYNIFLHLTESEEIRLEEQEKFAERQEAERRAAVKAERTELLKPYVPDVTVYMLDAMTPESFDQLLTGMKAAAEIVRDLAVKAEAERIAQAAAALKEQQRIADENARLKREADERTEADRKETERVKAELAERDRVTKELTAEREKELATYGETPLPGIGLFTEEVYREYLNNVKTRHHEIATRAAAEQKRLADEKAERERKSALHDVRAAELQPYGVDTEFMDLGSMDDLDFQGLLTKSKAEHELHEKEVADAARRAEERRQEELAAQKRHADALAEERRKADEIAAASLERERIAKAEKAKADAELARIRKEAEDRKKAEDEEEAAEERTRQLALAAPDADKVRAFAAAVNGLILAELTTDAGRTIATKIAEQQMKFNNWLLAEAEKLSPATTTEPDFNQHAAHL